MEGEGELRKDLRLLAKASIVVFIGVFLSKILIYVYRIAIARYLGPEVYGLFSLALLVVGLFVAFSSFGLSDGILRYIALFRGKKQDSKIRYIFNFSKKVLVVPSIISAILLFVFAEFISIKIFNNPSLIIFLQVFSVLIPIQIFSNLFLSTLRAFEKIGWYSFILNIFQNVLKVGFLILFIFLGLKANAVIFSYFLGIAGMLVLSFFISMYYLSKLSKKSKIKKESKGSIIKDLLSYSWPLLFLGIMGKFFTWTDTFMIGIFRSAEEVGFYNAAVPIAILLLFTTDLFMRMFFPLITREYSKKRFGTIKELSKQVGKWAFLLNLPVFLMMVIFPGAIINILFGPEYLVAANALRILAVGTIFVAMLSTISYNLISMVGRSKMILVNMIVFAILNIILNIILVPRYGIDGAAVATSISYVILSLIYAFQARYLVGVTPLRRKMVWILFSGVVSAGLLIFVKGFFVINLLSFILLGIFFFLVYIILVILTKSLDRNDLLVIDAIKEKVLGKNK